MIMRLLSTCTALYYRVIISLFCCLGIYGSYRNTGIPMADVISFDTSIYRSSRPGVFCKKGVLRNFAKFTGKNLCQSLFLNKVPGLKPEKRDSGTGIFL